MDLPVSNRLSVQLGYSPDKYIIVADALPQLEMHAIADVPWSQHHRLEYRYRVSPGMGAGHME